MSDRALYKLLEVAIGISDRAADKTGFVTLASLAHEIQADVKFRPLLVEGLAAQPRSNDGRWLILIDSETHKISEEMLVKESALSPLGTRLRNTVAHELAHALGPRFESALGSGAKSREAVVAMLERATEQLSPALLISSFSIETLLKSRTAQFDIAELTNARDRWGVSTRVFVKRLNLLSEERNNALQHHPRLGDIIIGSGEWLGVDRAELHSVPFKGFGKLLPEFVTQLRLHKKIVVSNYFQSPDFYLNGGSRSSSVEMVWFGTSVSPQSEKARLEISVESVSRKAGTSFLWMARKLG